MSADRPATHDVEDRDAVAARRMRGLVDDGQAHPLMADHWPVPVRWQNRWWHIPDTPTGQHGTARDGAGEQHGPGEVAGEVAHDIDAAARTVMPFVPAPAGLAQLCDQLAERCRAASAAVARPNATSIPDVTPTGHQNRS